MFVNNDDTSSGNPDTQSGDDSNPMYTETHDTLNEFWPSVQEEIKKIKHVDAKNQVLPLARIKKIMKLDEDVKMISAEAPLLFAKASEIFIHELTLRAWIHTEDNKRRTLQKNDIAMAITKYDQFDFLIDIVPRDEIKPKKEEPKSVVAYDQQGQYYFQIAQQALQGTTAAGPAMQTVAGNVTTGGGGTMNVNMNMGATGTTPVVTTTQPNHMTGQTLQLQSPTGQVTLATPQNIIVSNGQQMAVVNNFQPSNHQPQQIQLLQQVITPTGEVAQVPIPISPSQLNLLRMQMQGNTNQ